MPQHPPFSFPFLLFCFIFLCYGGAFFGVEKRLFLSSPLSRFGIRTYFTSVEGLDAPVWARKRNRAYQLAFEARFTGREMGKPKTIGEGRVSTPPLHCRWGVYARGWMKGEGGGVYSERPSWGFDS